MWCGSADRRGGRHKWKNVKSEVIQRINDRRKTGGGPPKKPLPYEELVTSIMGEQSPVIELRATVPDIFGSATSATMSTTATSIDPTVPDIFGAATSATTSTTATSIDPTVCDVFGSATSATMPATATAVNFDLSSDIAIIYIDEAAPHFCQSTSPLSSTLIEEQAEAEEAPEQSAKPPPTAPATGQKTERKRSRTTSATSKAGYQLTDIEHKYFESQIELNSKLQRALPSVEKGMTAWERFLVAKEEKLQLEIKLLKRQTEKDGQW